MSAQGGVGLTATASTPGRPASEVLASSRRIFEPALQAAVDTLPGSMRLLAGYHFGWWDEHGQAVVANGGKAIRPTLVALTAEAAGGSAEEAVPASVAIELVHNFSLIHDDVIDGDVTRRHRPTVWAAFGLSAAILAGDALLTLAFDVLAGSGHACAETGGRMLSAAVQAMIDGQSLDVDMERRRDVDLLECLNMARRKTGALLGCACGMGTLFGGGSPDLVADSRVFGEGLGLAFQFVDDLLGIWGDPAATGKPVYSDMRSRKKSLPVVAALTSGTPAGQELADLYAREQQLSAEDLERAAELIVGSGARAWARAQADGLLNDMLARVPSVDPESRAAAELGDIARMIIRRDH